ncbi:ACT domain-containing protein [Psychromonas ingrahamii]|uniref:ACT domain-containing protein n=1 Tax=Psychromonas ingrahamii TaxID=357794 RepID=UPI001E50F90D|nr:ACT domain-containing protein [Psychromonas ingrahamii]
MNAEKAHLKYEAVFKCITLMVYFSLEAIGLTAAVASKLVEKKISANVIAAYYHDHFFAQAEKSEMATTALNEFGS